MTSSPSDSPSTNPTPDLPLRERVAKAFTQLSASATELNAVSDELSKPIATIEGALKKINLGLPTWVKIAGHVDVESEHFWERAIGYAKFGGNWRIGIRTRAGHFDTDPTEEYWVFSDAPRVYRVEAVDKLPELLEALVTSASETAAKLKEKIATANEIAASLVAPEVRLKDSLLAQIKKSRAIFHTTVCEQAQRIDVSGDRITFMFAPHHRTLLNVFEKDRAWLESVAREISGRPIEVVASLASGQTSRK
jgi:hypothetical protein